jgi:hypothetical protein
MVILAGSAEQVRSRLNRLNTPFMALLSLSVKSCQFYLAKDRLDG